MRSRTILYWTSTAILSFALLSGGAVHIAQRPEAVEGMVHLGYPVYFMTILGVWKLLGGIALLAPRLPLLKEWAYAGVIFDMTGAAASHAVCGDGTRHIGVPLFFAACAVVSWALRPQSRTLADIGPIEWRSVSRKLATDVPTAR